MTDKKTKEKFNKLNKAIEQLALDIKYLEVPKRKKDREIIIKGLSKMSLDVGEIIETIHNGIYERVRK